MRVLAVLFVAGASIAPAFAVDTSLTQAGFSGLGVTPNAGVLGWGSAAFTYDNQLAGVVPKTSGHNYVLGFGFWPNIEIAGRLATNDLTSNCFTASGCGARDLSAAGKLGFALDRNGTWRVGAGVVDVGGGATYFRAAYGVLTWDSGPFQASGGLGKRSNSGVAGSRSLLGGPFASAAWQPVSTVRAQVETSDGQIWAGANVYAPAQWLPDGWQATLGYTQRLSNTPLTQRNWWTFGVTIPLYKSPQPARPVDSDKSPNLLTSPVQSQVPGSKSDSSDVDSKQAQPQAQPQSAAQVQGSVQDSDLKRLADALTARGLEDVSLGRAPDGLLAIRANNGSWEWNAADAVGAALGAISHAIGDQAVGFRFILTLRQVPFVAVTGRADCLRQWITTGSNTCTAGEITSPAMTDMDQLHRDVQWVIARKNPAWQRVRVNISPVFKTSFGTEFGAFDYSLGATVTGQLPTWDGGSVEAGVNVPLSNSVNYRFSEIFGNRRVQQGLDRLTLTQFARVPVERVLPGAPGAGSVTALGTIGRMSTIYDGWVGSIRWEPGDGRHRVSGMLGSLKNAEFGNYDSLWPTVRTSKPALASYRYAFQPTRTDFEATGGWFVNNDKAIKLTVRQWLGDTTLGLFYKRSQTKADTRVTQLLGLELTVPIGPRRDVYVGEHLQLGGTPRYVHSVETTFRTGVGGNPLAPGRGSLGGLPNVNDTMNSDRSGLRWWEDSVRRIREVARSQN